MSIFDKIKKDTMGMVNSAVSSVGNKREKFTFSALPESLEQMQALPEANLDSPYKTAALTVCALCAYAADKQIGTEMLNWLRGPRPLNGADISFINDRFRDGKTYIPFHILRELPLIMTIHLHSLLRLQSRVISIPMQNKVI